MSESPRWPSASRQHPARCRSSSRRRALASDGFPATRAEWKADWPAARQPAVSSPTPFRLAANLAGLSRTSWLDSHVVGVRPREKRADAQRGQHAARVVAEGEIDGRRVAGDLQSPLGVDRRADAIDRVQCGGQVGQRRVVAQRPFRSMTMSVVLAQPRLGIVRVNFEYAAGRREVESSGIERQRSMSVPRTRPTDRVCPTSP